MLNMLAEPRSPLESTQLPRRGHLSWLKRVRSPFFLHARAESPRKSHFRSPRSLPLLDRAPPALAPAIARPRLDHHQLGGTRRNRRSPLRGYLNAPSSFLVELEGS